MRLATVVITGMLAGSPGGIYPQLAYMPHCHAVMYDAYWTESYDNGMTFTYAGPELIVGPCAPIPEELR